MHRLLSFGEEEGRRGQMNKETTVQVSDTTMMTRAKMFVTKKNKSFRY
jgi:hypothetical protein